MATFYLDLAGSSGSWAHQEGLEFSDVEAARKAVIKSLPAIAQEELGEQLGHFYATLRNSDGHAVARFHLRTSEMKST